MAQGQQASKGPSQEQQQQVANVVGPEVVKPMNRVITEAKTVPASERPTNSVAFDLDQVLLAIILAGIRMSKGYSGGDKKSAVAEAKEYLAALKARV